MEPIIKFGKKRKLLKRLDSTKLKSLKIAIERHHISVSTNLEPVKRGLGDPELLDVHIGKCRNEPIFNRDDIIINNDGQVEIDNSFQNSRAQSENKTAQSPAESTTTIGHFGRRRRLLECISITELTKLKVGIRRNKLSNSSDELQTVTLKRSLDDPELLQIHFGKPIYQQMFDRDDIVVNNYEAPRFEREIPKSLANAQNKESSNPAAETNSKTRSFSEYKVIRTSQEEDCRKYFSCEVDSNISPFDDYKVVELPTTLKDEHIDTFFKSEINSNENRTLPLQKRSNFSSCDKSLKNGSSSSYNKDKKKRDKHDNSRNTTPQSSSSRTMTKSPKSPMQRSRYQSSHRSRLRYSDYNRCNSERKSSRSSRTPSRDSISPYSRGISRKCSRRREHSSEKSRELKPAEGNASIRPSPNSTQKNLDENVVCNSNLYNFQNYNENADGSFMIPPILPSFLAQHFIPYPERDQIIQPIMLNSPEVQNNEDLNNVQSNQPDSTNI